MQRLDTALELTPGQHVLGMAMANVMARKGKAMEKVEWRHERGRLVSVAGVVYPERSWRTGCNRWLWSSSVGGEVAVSSLKMRRDAISACEKAWRDAGGGE